MPNSTDATWPDNLNTEPIPNDPADTRSRTSHGQTRLRFQAALTRAHQALENVQSIEKTMWSSPAGKIKLASRLVAMLPPHSTYVEPFAGSAAVLFAKEPAPVEVLNDADLEIADAYKSIKRLTSSQLKQLQGMPWTGDKATFTRLLDVKPKDAVQKLHRFLYLTNFSYGHLRNRSFNPNAVGVTARTIKRIETHGERLKRVRIYGQDYEKIIHKYDSKNTLFFFDPPYVGYDVSVGEKKFDEEQFFDVIKNLKGKFLLTYGVRGKLPKLLKKAGFNIKRIRTPRTINSMRGVGGSNFLTQLVVTNYAVKPSQKKTTEKLFSKSIPIIKNLDPNDERFVMGIVLEPEVVDAQGDIYSEEEIRKAAHRFMEDSGDLGFMHQHSLADQVRILETYLAPSDLTLGQTTIRKGTWLLAVRILSDEVWQQVRIGEITGFSIGGSARSLPENASVEST